MPNASATIESFLSYPARQRVELAERPATTAPLADEEVAGRTLVTLVSPGTELNGLFLADIKEPRQSGYAAIVEIDRVGAGVSDLRPGDRVFCANPHQSRQRAKRDAVVPVPHGLRPEIAVFARLMAVGWASLTITDARPPDRVVVFGLGPVGNLAAQIFSAAGYQVTAIEPTPGRRDLARRLGIEDVRPAADPVDPDRPEAAQLALECSGHEQAALDATNVLRANGELVLVATPWRKRCDLDAHALLRSIFHRYIRVRSGWEWQVGPLPSRFAIGSTVDNLAGAMRWLRDGRVRVEGLATVAAPADAQRVYDDLMNQRGTPTAVFDWTALV
ncbi:MAG TPA: zinc-binding alcohol dehydrogenase [Tepidisphaeraceae bacterium]|nr:zinc-binding alcohol dehydrogenase [Tepidisphaeraceae bacterium]